MKFKGRLKKLSGKFPDYGAIFMSNGATLRECLKNQLFGLPTSFTNFVKGVKIGMILFLFAYEKRELHGVFRASSDGELNIIPHAYSSSQKQFPAQVRITTVWYCHPLSEYEFRPAIHNNYFAPKKFNFGLSKDQVHKLLHLFSTRRVWRIQSQSDKENKTSEMCHKEMEKNRGNDIERATKKLKRDIDTFSHSNLQSLHMLRNLFLQKIIPRG